MNTYKGIDVSYAQGKIDWAKVDKSQVQFVVLRAGYGNDASQIDKQFLNNVKGCKEHNIPFAVYWFSYARSPEEAKQEALACISVISQVGYPFFIAYDFEGDSKQYAERNGVNVTRGFITACAKAFLDAVAAAKYTPVLYANLDYIRNYYDLSQLDYKLWYAQYNAVMTLKGEIAMWQFTSTGVVAGISGKVDLNISYEDFGVFGKQVDQTQKPLPVISKPVKNKTLELKVGDKVTFKGGTVYTSSTAKTAAAEKGKATCQVTGVAAGAPHPYHCVGGGVYGWVDAKYISIAAPVINPAPANSKMMETIKAGDTIAYKGTLYGDSYGNNPGKTVSGTYKVDRVIEGRKYGIHIPAGWIDVSKVKRK